MLDSTSSKVAQRKRSAVKQHLHLEAHCSASVEKTLHSKSLLSHCQSQSHLSCQHPCLGLQLNHSSCHTVVMLRVITSHYYYSNQNNIMFLSGWGISNIKLISHIVHVESVTDTVQVDGDNGGLVLYQLCGPPNPWGRHTNIKWIYNRKRKEGTADGNVAENIVCCELARCVYSCC